ncbi:MAG TPA: class I SAM-dependent methyltransferase, partial [Trebonia sp.]
MTTVTGRSGRAGGSGETGQAPVTVVSRPGSPRPVTPQSILAARLEELARRLDRDGGSKPALKNELRELAELAGGLDPYLSRHTTPESADLARLARQTESEDWNRHAGMRTAGYLEQEMLSGHVEGQLLKMLVHATRAVRVLEIGMFTGYSALAMAEALPDDGQVTACEIDSGVAAFAERCFRESASGRKITVKVGPAQRALAELAQAGQRFDLVFIDADKAGYLDYLTTVLEGGLLEPHGLICVDNTLMQGQPWLAGEPTANGAAIAHF